MNFTMKGEWFSAKKSRNEVKNIEYVSLMSAAQKAAFVQNLISKLAWQWSYERFEMETERKKKEEQRRT